MNISGRRVSLSAKLSCATPNLFWRGLESHYVLPQEKLEAMSVLLLCLPQSSQASAAVGGFGAIGRLPTEFQTSHQPLSQQYLQRAVGAAGK